MYQEGRRAQHEDSESVVTMCQDNARTTVLCDSIYVCCRLAHGYQ